MTRSLVVLDVLVHAYHVSIIYHKERDNTPPVCSLKIFLPAVLYTTYVIP